MLANLLEKYLDADMGLADDITDRALQAHMADLRAAKESNAEDSGEIPRLKSRDSTKELGSIIKQIGAAPKCYGLFNGGVNTAVTSMPTKKYREVQINLRLKEAAREAFTDSMLGMMAQSMPWCVTTLQKAAAQTSSSNSCKTSALKQQSCWVCIKRPGRCSPEDILLATNGSCL